MLIYFLRGELPWQVCEKEPTGKRNESILKAKKDIGAKDLCPGGLPEFLDYFTEIQSLDDKKPDYAKLRELFMQLFRRFSFKDDYQYEWVRRSELVRRSNEKENEGPSGVRP